MELTSSECSSEALAREQARNAELRECLRNGASAGDDSEERIRIPRPKGTAGKDFSIQQEMGLSGSPKKYETYKAIQVRKFECYSTEIFELIIAHTLS